MQVSLEQVGALERQLKIEVPEQQIEAQVKSRLSDVARNARIDGFRPGKAPARVVESRFGAKVRNEVIGEVLRKSFAEAIDSHQLRLVAEPVIDPITATPGAGLSYTATFEVYPNFTLVPFNTIEVERPQCTIGEADLDRMIEVLRAQNKTWSKVAREAQLDDQVTIDFEGKVDGAPFAGGSAQGFDLVLGAGRMIDSFESGLIGVTADSSRVLTIDYPADYHRAELAGKPVTFEIAIKQVAEPVLPTLDAEFFSKFGVVDGGLEAFRAEVRQNMERERARAAERRFNSHVLDRVREANDFELPKSLVRVESMRMQQEMQRMMSTRGLDATQLGGTDPVRFEPEAAKRVKLGLIVAEIIKQAEIKVQPAKVRARVEAMAASYEQPEALVRWYYEDPRRLQEIEGVCLEEEAVKWIADQTRITDVTVSFDDLMNPRQTASQAPTGDDK